MEPYIKWPFFLLHLTRAGTVGLWPLKNDQEERSEQSKNNSGELSTQLKLPTTSLTAHVTDSHSSKPLTQREKQTKKNEVVVRKHIIVLYDTMA